MFELARTVARSVVSAIQGRRNLALENLALRHQIAVLQRRSKKPHLKGSDRVLWMALRRLWPEWKSGLYIVQPATVVKWHRAGFKRCWCDTCELALLGRDRRGRSSSRLRSIVGRGASRGCQAKEREHRRMWTPQHRPRSPYYHRTPGRAPQVECRLPSPRRATLLPWGGTQEGGCKCVRTTRHWSASCQLQHSLSC